MDFCGYSDEQQGLVLELDQLLQQVQAAIANRQYSGREKRQHIGKINEFSFTKFELNHK